MNKDNNKIPANDSSPEGYYWCYGQMNKPNGQIIYTNDEISLYPLVQIIP